MKNLLTILVIVLIGTTASAQYDQKAKNVLDAMSSKYQKIPAYKSDFTYELINEVDGINEKFEGEITVKGEMYRLALDEQLVINNGNTVWNYLPDVNEVNIESYDPEEAEMSPSKIYTAYKKGYKYIYLGDESCAGGTCAVVDLVAEDKDAQIFKIKLFINKSDNSLEKWTMFDKTGNKFIYTIDNFNPNVNVKDTYFTFDASKYPGVEVIDLR